MAAYYVHIATPDFLHENRTDPITGDLIRPGDKVVFCANCQSAFLQGSWEYLEGEHCGQTDTLPDIPKTQSLSLRWELDGRLFRAYQMQRARETGISMVAAFVLIQIFVRVFSVASDIAPFLYGTMYALSTLLPLPFQRGRVSAIEIFKNGFRVRRILKKKTTHRLHTIDRFVVRRRKGFLVKRLFELTFQFKNGKTETIVFGDNKSTAKDFLRALKYLSAQVPVYLELPEGEAKAYAQFLKRTYQLGSNFVIAEDELPETPTKKTLDA